jgi:hypothetical protein
LGTDTVNGGCREEAEEEAVYEPERAALGTCWYLCLRLPSSLRNWLWVKFPVRGTLLWWPWDLMQKTRHGRWDSRKEEQR